MSLSGKACVVTGGASGIGRATAIEMIKRDARGVAVLDIDDDGGAETVELIRELGQADAYYLRCDMRSGTEIAAAMQAAAAALGGIDVLHNNAGIHEAFFTDQLTVDTCPDDVWQLVCDVNLRGPWLCIKHAAPFLRASANGPSIVNASSTGGIVSQAKNVIYGPTKAAIQMMTKQVAIDLAPNVRCNCYSPASVRTPMVEKVTKGTAAPGGGTAGAVKAKHLSTHLLPRVGEPEDVARLVCFLASDEANWITGAHYVIDGGVTAWRGAHEVPDDES